MYTIYLCTFNTLTFGIFLHFHVASAAAYNLSPQLNVRITFAKRYKPKFFLLIVSGIQKETLIKTIIILLPLCFLGSETPVFVCDWVWLWLWLSLWCGYGCGCHCIRTPIHTTLRYKWKTISLLQMIVLVAVNYTINNNTYTIHIPTKNLAHSHIQTSQFFQEKTLQALRCQILQILIYYSKILFGFVLYNSQNHLNLKHK